MAIANGIIFTKHKNGKNLKTRKLGNHPNGGDRMGTKKKMRTKRRRKYKQLKPAHGKIPLYVSEHAFQDPWKY